MKRPSARARLITLPFVILAGACPGCGALIGPLGNDYLAGGNDASAESSGGDSAFGGDAQADVSGGDGDGSAAAEASPGDSGPGSDALLPDGSDTGTDAGTDTGSDAQRDPSEGGEAGGPCTLGTRRCSGNGVETCESNGQWSAPWPCATGSCSAGECTGSTTGSGNPSCAPGGSGMTDCGSSSESCCTSLEVPSGMYYRTYTNTGSGPTGEADLASVSGFRLDKYVVTVGRFRQFATAWNNGAGFVPSAGSGKHAHLNGGQGLVNVAIPGTYETGWVATDDANIAPTTANLSCQGGYSSTWTDKQSGQENLPIDCVTWQEAYAFCIWDEGFLPSEAEWGYAAGGGKEEREYPWGSTAPGTSSQYAIYGCYYDGTGSCSQSSGLTYIAPVGTATDGFARWGQLDLTGEVTEWVLDWYASAYVNPSQDGAYLAATSQKSARGGDYYNGTQSLPSELRGGTPPADRDFAYLGFRCARTP